MATATYTDKDLAPYSSPQGADVSAIPQSPLVANAGHQGDMVINNNAINTSNANLTRNLATLPSPIPSMPAPSNATQDVLNHGVLGANASSLPSSSSFSDFINH